MDDHELLEYVPITDRLLIVFRDNFIQIISGFLVLILLILAWNMLTLEVRLGIFIILGVYFGYIYAFYVEKKAFAERIKEQKAQGKKNIS